MASVSYIGTDNLILTSVLTSNSATGLGPENLANDQGSPASAWQSAPGVVTQAAGALINARFATPGQLVQGFALTRTNLTPAAKIGFQLWRDPGPTLVYGPGTDESPLVLPGPVPRYGQVAHVLAAPIVADFAQIFINDPTNPDGFLNVPLCFVGPLWNLAVGFSWESSHGREAVSARRRSAGGQVFGDLRYRARTFDMRLSGVTAAEWPLLDALDHDARDDRNILVIPDATSPNLQTSAVFGTVTPTAGITYPFQSADARAWAATVEERL